MAAPVRFDVPQICHVLCPVAVTPVWNDAFTAEERREAMQQAVRESEIADSIGATPQLAASLNGTASGSAEPRDVSPWPWNHGRAAWTDATAPFHNAGWQPWISLMPCAEGNALAGLSVPSTSAFVASSATRLPIGSVSHTCSMAAPVQIVWKSSQRIVGQPTSAQVSKQTSAGNAVGTHQSESGPRWSIWNSEILGPTGCESLFAGRITLLDAQKFSSATATCDALNMGSVDGVEDGFCVMFSRSKQMYILLWRGDKKDLAFLRLGMGKEDSVDAAISLDSPIGKLDCSVPAANASATTRAIAPRLQATSSTRFDASPARSRPRSPIRTRVSSPKKGGVSPTVTRVSSPKKSDASPTRTRASSPGRTRATLGSQGGDVDDVWADLLSSDWAQPSSGMWKPTWSPANSHQETPSQAAGSCSGTWKKSWAVGAPPWSPRRRDTSALKLGFF